MKAKTARMTVECPYCGCPYTFKSEARRKAFKDFGAGRPLHPACVVADKRDRVCVEAAETFVESSFHAATH